MRKVVLCILDGWGVRADHKMNGIAAAKNWQKIINDFPYTELQASEEYVGLPAHQMGNSEVGHMTIGLGRTIEQELLKIDNSINSGSFENNPNIQLLVNKVKQVGGTCHLMGLLSPGGVHSHQNHMMAIANLLSNLGINVFIHAFLDGRDTPPKSSLEYILQFERNLPVNAKIVTVTGRYYAMDRDQRFDRTKLAYDAMVSGIADRSFSSACEGIKFYYEQQVFDEFIPPFVVGDYRGMEDADLLWMANFRSDRVRQILLAILDEDFNDFERHKVVKLNQAIAMTEYSEKLNSLMSVVFHHDSTSMGLSEVISLKGMKQLHIAETEKYAHVTFFFNGGVEKPFWGEDRVLIPSPKVATYDLQPEMCAFEVKDAVCNAIAEDKYQLIIVNFANTDMVGHTGISEAIEQAVRVVDQCVEDIKNYALQHNWAMVITADHGNAEEMLDANGQPHTAHTCNPVPLVLINSGYQQVLSGGTLADVAPTILQIMGIDKPKQMTGNSLCVR